MRVVLVVALRRAPPGAPLAGGDTTLVHDPPHRYRFSGARSGVSVRGARVVVGGRDPILLELFAVVGAVDAVDARVSGQVAPHDGGCGRQVDKAVDESPRLLTATGRSHRVHRAAGHRPPGRGGRPQLSTGPVDDCGFGDMEDAVVHRVSPSRGRSFRSATERARSGRRAWNLRHRLHTWVWTTWGQRCGEVRPRVDGAASAGRAHPAARDPPREPSRRTGGVRRTAA